jgi:hypothetical protein
LKDFNVDLDSTYALAYELIIDTEYYCRYNELRRDEFDMFWNHVRVLDEDDEDESPEKPIQDFDIYTVLFQYCVDYVARTI